MPFTSTVGLMTAFAIGLGLLGPAATHAEPATFPQQAVRIVVPTGPGSAPDVLTRKLSETLKTSLGTSVVVENRPGAAGMIGAETVARAPGDGHTVLMAWDGMMAINPSLYKKMSYHPMRDFKPVAGLARVEFALVAHPSFPPSSVNELVKYAQARPGEINYASPGAGEAHHIAMEELKRQASIDLVHVAYKGGPAALNDVLAGHVSIAIIGLTPALPHIAAQRLKVLAVLGNERSQHLPNTPTLTETLPKFDVEGSWLALFVPASTPDATVRTLSNAVSTALASPELRAYIRSQGMIPLPLDPQALNTLLREDTERFRRIIRAADIHVDG